MADYNYGSYLDQVPGYESSTTAAERIAQATAASNLAFDPQRQEAERQRRYNEMQGYNNMNKIQASEAGIDKTLQYNASQAKKANSINAASRGGGNGDGLSAYLNNQTDTALAGQKLNIAGDLAADKFNANQSMMQSDRESQKQLGEIEGNRGNAAQVYLTNMNNAEAERETAWKMNALNVANAIGSGEMNAEDINARLEMAANAITSQESMQANSLASQEKLAQLPWTLGMTPYQKDQSAQGWTGMFGALPGGDGEGKNNVGLSAYASSFASGAPTVSWDATNNNVIVGDKSYTPETLTKDYGAVFDDTTSRWKMAQSSADKLLFNK